MFCVFQTLDAGEDGYVVRCQHCNHYQLVFLTTMLTLEHSHFKSFYKQAMYRAAGCYDHHNPQAKCILLATPNKNAQLILTVSELYKLAQMLESADSELKTQALLMLFTPNA